MAPVQQALTRTLLDLIAIPSVTGDEARICGHVEGRLRRGRPTAEIRRVGNSVAVGVPQPGDARPSLALFGHLDTVPGEQAPGRVEGDSLIGLGASDMKAGLAVMLELWDRLPADATLRLALAFYDREEGDYDLNGLGPLMESEPWLAECDLGLCLEPTDGQLQLGCVGSLHARLTVRGKAAHSARPWLGENAIYRALPLLSELAEIAPREVISGGLAFREVTTVTLAEAGGGRNVVPAAFTLNVNVRFAPGRSPEEAEAELRALVADHAEVEIIDRAPAATVASDNPLLQRLAEAGGLELQPKQAWTDVARLAAAGCDAANFGPGLQTEAHKVGERCEISKMVRGYQQLAALLG